MGKRTRIVSVRDSGTIVNGGEDQNRECERASRTRVDGRNDQNRECERVSGTRQWDRGPELLV